MAFELSVNCNEKLTPKICYKKYGIYCQLFKRLLILIDLLEILVHNPRAYKRVYANIIFKVMHQY